MVRFADDFVMGFANKSDAGTENGVRLKMGSCRYVYNCGCCVELQCSLLVDGDAAGWEVELIEPIDELCYTFAGWK